MIDGHGDDAYRYDGIRSDFSSNICQPAHHHEALMAHLAARPELIGHYPEPEAWSLEAMIARRLGIAPECVIVTNGATDAIYLIAQVFRHKPVILAPTFSEYVDASASAGSGPRGTMLWLCNPNNPTGEVYEQSFVDGVAADHDLVVMDHSYEQYTDATLPTSRWACRSQRYILIHSFTKTYAVPGLRLGYITAHPSLTAAMRRLLRPWSVSALAVEAGKFLLQHDELICRPDLVEAQRLRVGLIEAGIDVRPTRTNFMLCCLDAARGTAAELKERLARRHRILIRDASNFQGLTPQHFRVAAQTPAENAALVAALREELPTLSETIYPAL